MISLADALKASIATHDATAKVLAKVAASPAPNANLSRPPNQPTKQEASKETMKVIEPNEPITVTHVATLIYGDPGVGKSTLANTARDPIILDFDRGAHRAHNRRRVIQPDNVVESLAWIEANRNSFGDVVVDTTGRLVDVMLAQATKTGRRGRNGAVDMRDVWGAVKTQFVAFRDRIFALGKDVVLIAHAKEDKDGERRIMRPDIAGGSLAEILKCAEFVAYYSTVAGRRVLDFSPTDSTIGKNPCQWDQIEVPHYTAAPSFLADLIADGKAKLGQISEQGMELDREIAEWRARLDEAAEPETLNVLTKSLSKLGNATLKAGVWALFIQRGKAIGAKFDAKDKAFKADEKAAA